MMDRIITETPLEYFERKMEQMKKSDNYKQVTFDIMMDIWREDLNNKYSECMNYFIEDLTETLKED